MFSSNSSKTCTRVDYESFSFQCLAQVPPLRFLNIGGNSIGDDGAAIVSEGLIAAAGLRLLMLRFIGLDNNSM